MPNKELVRRGFRITGRVQGVFFRLWTQEFASKLGLSGTVRNRSDGSVEVHALGSEEVLEAFQAGLWEGPPASSVDGVEVVESEEDFPVGSFQVLR